MSTPGALQGDTLTKAELEHFRGAVAAALKVGAPGSPAYAFPPEDAAEAGLERPRHVFSVISSCVVDASMGGCAHRLFLYLAACELDAAATLLNQQLSAVYGIIALLAITLWHWRWHVR